MLREVYTLVGTSNRYTVDVVIPYCNGLDSRRAVLRDLTVWKNPRILEMSAKIG